MSILKRIVTKGKAVVRRGPSALRNMLFSRLRIWPVRSMRDHWIATIPTYCISLKGAEARRALVESQVVSMGIERFAFVDAVEAKDLSYEMVERQMLYASNDCKKVHGRDLSLQEIACSLSHARAYEQIAASQDGWALILEDDALFRCTRLAAIEWQDIPSNTDVVYLSAFLSATPPLNLVRGVVYRATSYAGSAAAYLVSRAAARRLAEVAIPVVHAADGLLGRVTNHHAESDNNRSVKDLPLLSAVIVHPEAVNNGSVEHYHISTISQ